MWTQVRRRPHRAGHARARTRSGSSPIPTEVETGYVVRMPKAYPVYDEHYEGNVDTMRKWLEANTPNVFPCGRNGMHKYNNQDHSMLTAMLSVENILGADHDVWAVNVEAEYHEEVDGTGRGTPASGAARAATRRCCRVPRRDPNPPVRAAERVASDACPGLRVLRRAARSRIVARTTRVSTGSARSRQSQSYCTMPRSVPRSRSARSGSRSPRCSGRSASTSRTWTRASRSSS